jgi:hypothetical protein
MGVGEPGRVRRSGRRRDRASPAGTEPEDPRGTVVRVVRLLRHEDRQWLLARKTVVPGVDADDRLPCSGERGEISGRPAGREESLDVRAEPQRLAQPLKQPLLHCVGDGTHLVLGGAVIEHGRHELREGRRPDRRADLVSNVARVMEVVGGLEHRRQELGDRDARRLLRGGRPLLQGRAGDAYPGDQSVASGGAGQVVRKLVDDGMARRPKPFGVNTDRSRCLAPFETRSFRA